MGIAGFNWVLLSYGGKKLKWIELGFTGFLKGFIEFLIMFYGVLPGFISF